MTTTFNPVAPRLPQGRRRARRHLLARRPSRDALAQDAATREDRRADEVERFLAIDAQGRVTVYSGKVELGTGVGPRSRRSPPKSSVPFDRSPSIQGDTALTPDQGPTYASLSIQDGGMQIRRAAATAREALARRRPPSSSASSLSDAHRRRTASSAAGGKGVSYAELVGGKTFSHQGGSRQAPKLKDPKDYTIVGKSVPRLDIPAKISGTFNFMQDVSVPGMLHARVVHPPAIGAQARKLRRRLDQDPRLRARGAQGQLPRPWSAKNEWAAIKALAQLEAKWSDWAGLPEQAKLFEYVRDTKVDQDEDLQQRRRHRRGAWPRRGGRCCSATYDFAINTHGSIGPSCAVADFKDGKLTSGRPRRRPTAAQAARARCRR